jgi:ribosome-associated heat shock protein Hsp15
VESLRLDKWLWFARFLKSRSMAQGLIEEGGVRINGQSVTKTATPVKPGDEVLFPQGKRWRLVRVTALGKRRGPAQEAQSLYVELPPPPLSPFE